MGIVNEVLLLEFADRCEEVKKYEGKIVKVSGYVYKKSCEPDMQIQCRDKKEIRNIESIRIVKGFSKVSVSTDKTEYEQRDTIKLTIKNNSDKNNCLESCNTYYFEKKNISWTEYSTKACEANFIRECIDSLSVKEFEIKLSGTDFEKGVYRIAVPVYISCQNKEFPCKEDKTIYSNEFTIKEKEESVIDCEKLDSQFCEKDEDCICKSEGCFIGSKLYWENCVDKNVLCFDLCPQSCECASNKCNCTNIPHA